MELVVTNSLEGTRRKTLHGRKFLVANVTMIVPGVLNGSKGPLLYAAADVEASADSWNHMPIVVYHPKVDGQHVSARRPDVLEKYAVGHVFNTSFSQGKLVGEGWFDEERTKAVDPRVHAALVKRQPMEISTGLFTKNEPVANGATFNGTSYTHVAKDYRPDHLAVLPDQAGACGLKHGCGLMVNEAGVCANCGGKGGKPGRCPKAGGPAALASTAPRTSYHAEADAAKAKVGEVAARLAAAKDRHARSVDELKAVGGRPGVDSSGSEDKLIRGAHGVMTHAAGEVEKHSQALKAAVATHDKATAAAADRDSHYAALRSLGNTHEQATVKSQTRDDAAKRQAAVPQAAPKKKSLFQRAKFAITGNTENEVAHDPGSDGVCANCGGEGGKPGPCAGSSSGSHDTVAEHEGYKLLEDKKTGSKHIEDSTGRIVKLGGTKGGFKDFVTEHKAKKDHGTKPSQLKFEGDDFKLDSSKPTKKQGPTGNTENQMTHQLGSDGVCANCGGEGGKPGPCPNSGGSGAHSVNKERAERSELAAKATAVAHEKEHPAYHQLAADAHGKAAQASFKAGATQPDGSFLPHGAGSDGDKASYHAKMERYHTKKSFGKKAKLPTANERSEMPHDLGSDGVCVNCGGEGGKPGPCPNSGGGAKGRGLGGEADSHDAAAHSLLKSAVPGAHVLRTTGNYVHEPKVVAHHEGGPKAAVDEAKSAGWKLRKGYQNQEEHVLFHPSDPAHTLTVSKSHETGGGLAGSSVVTLHAKYKPKPTGNQDNAMTRDQMTAELTTNCDCWKGDKATLDALPADKVASIHESHKSAVANAAVVNTLTEGLTVNGVSVSLEEGNVLHVDASGLTANAPFPGAAKPFGKKGKKDEEDEEDEEDDAEKKAEDEDDEEDEKPTKKDKKMTTNQWLAAAPSEVQGAVRNAMKIVEGEKRALVKQLTANVSGDKTAWGNRLMAKPIEELREMRELIPAPVVVNHFAPANLEGAGGWNDPVANEDLETLAPTPTVNFAAAARKQGDKR